MDSGDCSVPGMAAVVEAGLAPALSGTFHVVAQENFQARVGVRTTLVLFR